MNDYVYIDHIEIGLTIRKLRIQAGISQSKLAEGICDRTAIIHLEKGRAKQPSIYLLNQLCRRLSITLDDFFLLAYEGKENQFWLKTNEIEALMKTKEFEKAYILASQYYNDSLHPVDKQYYGLIKANYLYSMNKYKLAKDKYYNSLCITSSCIKDKVYTLNEMRLISGLIYCNWKIDKKLNNDETLNYIRILNSSIQDYPIDKDFRLVISILICIIQFHFALKQYDYTISTIHSTIELSHKYCCYSYLGNLWFMLASIYEVLDDKEKARRYYEKSNTFFNLFDDNTGYMHSFKHQMEIYKNINC